MSFLTIPMADLRKGQGCYSTPLGNLELKECKRLHIKEKIDIMKLQGVGIDL